MKRLSIIIFVVLFTGQAFTGGIVDKTSFYSGALNKTREVYVYLPEGYDPAGAINYPVIYYLHGAGGNQKSAFTYPINLETSLNNLIANKKIQPSIVVAADGSNPPANGCWYTNSIHPDFGNFEDYIVHDLVEFVEMNYKAIPSREKRGIQGISMGGFGCMKLGLKYPTIYKGVASNAGAFEFWTFFDPYWISAILLENSGPPYNFDPNAGAATQGVFTMCAAFSPNLNNPPYYVDFILDQNGNIDPTAKAQWELHNPAYLATVLPPDANLSIYFDCGNLDELMFHPANVKFSEILGQLKIPYEFESYVGTHTSKAGSRAKIGVEKLDAAMEEKYLVSDSQTISGNNGGVVNLYLTAGWDNANRQYIMLGSISGTAPGTPLPGGIATLPLNWDIFTTLTIHYSNTALFQNFMGTLSNEGFGTAHMNLGPVAGVAGLTMHFAYALNNPWDFVSNPVAVEIIP